MDRNELITFLKENLRIELDTDQSISGSYLTVSLKFNDEMICDDRISLDSLTKL